VYERVSRRVGSVVISVDAELGWGSVDFDTPPESRVENARSGWLTLCDLLAEYDVPATWAVVGHLFHESCDGRHPDHPVGTEWFARKRKEWADRPALRYAADPIETIRDSGPAHEIGCHTYSHVEFGAPETTETVATAELERSLDVAEEWGIDLTSAVYPRNNVGHRRVLADYGFESYRGRQPASRRSLPEKLRTVAFGSGHPPLVTPTVDEHGLIDIPASLFLFSFEGAPLRLSQPVVGDPVIELVERGLAAADSDGVLHLWLHPNNLVGDAHVQRIDAIPRATDEHRDAVSVTTMGEIARRFGKTTA